MAFEYQIFFCEVVRAEGCDPHFRVVTYAVDLAKWQALEEAAAFVGVKLGEDHLPWRENTSEGYC